MRYLILVFLLLLNAPVFVQGNPGDTLTAHSAAEALIDTTRLDVVPSAPMADALRADGKIWVVVSTLLIVLAGFFFYLIRLDSRLTKLEKRCRL